ncbi:unnamed protein product [Dracunculus medinensis]|uniref:Uncharacterized protein n=1 Tax=Dracunculus medinensis TaxID=318479 RepID=A0A0N4UM42_DRAME|nr:unnamed protein product [Dracunculus medinensis]
MLAFLRCAKDFGENSTNDSFFATTIMAVFKKLKKSKDKNAIPEPEPIKQLDSRFGMDSYRDFFTLKNYWKSVDRKKVESANFLFYRILDKLMHIYLHHACG